MQNQKQRSLKVQPKYQPRAYKTTIVPEIRLCGKWLEEAGFISGQRVTVQHELNKIIITTHAK